MDPKRLTKPQHLNQPHILRNTFCEETGSFSSSFPCRMRRHCSTCSGGSPISDSHLQPWVYNLRSSFFFALYAYHFKALIPTVLLSLGQTVKLSGLALGTEQLRLRLWAVWVALNFAVWVVALQTELLASKVTVERNSKAPPPPPAQPSTCHKP